jgi:hypothetical protein
MDLTEDEQWEILEPLIPTPPRRREDGRGRPWRDPPDVLNGISSGSCAPERPGRTFHNAIHPTRPPVIVAFRSGSKKGFLAADSKLWPKTSKSAGR